MALRFSGSGKPYADLVESNELGPKWTGRIHVVTEKMDEPVHWKKPRMVFVCSMGDLFHENVGTDVIQSLFDVMFQAKQHTYQILTKRAERMSRILPHIRFPGGMKWQDAPEPNIWVGVSVEDRPRADERIPELRKTPARVRFLSCEPLLGDLGQLDLRGISWVVVGCESGPGARPMGLDWARSIRDQCAAAGVKFFFKQAMAACGTLIRMPLLDGKRWAEFPDKDRTVDLSISGPAGERGKQMVES
jgi:protein gp37